MALLTELRTDQLGSLVRPAWLRALFQRHAAGRASDQELRVAQDAAIQESVRKQESIGLPIVGDGEFRRWTFMDSYADVKGLDFSTLRSSRDVSRTREDEPRASGPARVSRVAVCEQIRLLRNRPLDEYEFVQSLTEQPAKMTLLSADRVWQLFSPDDARRIYPNDDAFLADVVSILRTIITGLVRAGCRYVQVDGPGYAAYSDPNWIAYLRGHGLDPIGVLRRSAAADASAIDGFEDVTFGVHLCSGNADQVWHPAGNYDGTAEALFNSLPHDRFLVDYDNERGGSFAPLRFAPRNKVVVLGLISTKTPVLESEDDLLRRIEDATEYIDVDQLALSPQCGFASDFAEAACTPDEQWRKLELMVRVAERVWL